MTSEARRRFLFGSTQPWADSRASTTAKVSDDLCGTLTGSTGSVTTPLGFAGEYTDAETGFVYLRNRYYDPATGQFISRDPLTAITRSPYGYVGGNPLNRTDPLGLYWGEGVVQRVTNAANWATSCLATYCVGHLAEAIVAPIALAVISGVVIYGGVLACATGLGCIVGAPLFAIGVVGIAAFIYLAHQEIRHWREFTPKVEAAAVAFRSSSQQC